MSYHPRIESAELSSFLTTRSRNSRLWFVNNRKLEHAILGYAARYSHRYDVQLYAIAIEGNHIQAAARFPLKNRALFMRDFNSSVARAVARFTPEYDEGRLWARRYSQEFLPGKADIEEYFFYIALQPVQDGLVERISEYPGYNCFRDAVQGKEREFKVINWGLYHKKKLSNPAITIDDCTEVIALRFARLPGYEHLSQHEYARYMYSELERRRRKIVLERRNNGQGFLGTAKLRRVQRGALPHSTKTSARDSHRPRVLSVCKFRRAECLAWYFDVYFTFKKASRNFRDGDLLAHFPPGTYRPISAVTAIRRRTI
jgi:hypothetical protein